MHLAALAAEAKETDPTAAMEVDAQASAAEAEEFFANNGAFGGTNSRVAILTAEEQEQVRQLLYFFGSMFV